MPPDRGRASQACTACRKQKTRCYGSGNPTGGCLRCDRLQLSCSLGIPTISGHHDPETRENSKGSVYNDRLSRLEHAVDTVVARLDRLAPGTTSTVSGGRSATIDRCAMEAPGNLSSDPTYSAREEAPPEIASTAPVFVIRDVAREVGSPQDQRISNANAFSYGSYRDLIDGGLLGLQDATSLLALFVQHYGRWVAFQETTSPSPSFLPEVRRSPLLLCTCCLIAVRHTTDENASRLAPLLFQEAKSLLSTALLVVPQSMAFFQAALILSLWSTTVGQAVMSIDSWLVSGFALQHCLSSDLFAPIISTTHLAPLTRQEVDRWFIWNHLCVVHLQYCVGTRRKALLDREQVQRCGRILDSDHATNFETRMVAEVNLYWIIYESCSAITVDVPGTQTLFNSWKQEWKFLFDQPRPQFIQMAFHFGQLLVYEKALKSRSAKVRESLLSEMVRLSAAIITLAMQTTDMRTQHLTDHIYHLITFAAVTLCRLLHMYEDKLAQSHNVPELDQLILNLVTWLQTIGLLGHVSHTLGDVVSAFHEKLRPIARPTPQSYEDADAWAQADLSLFSDLHGTELFYAGNGAFLPDWEPYIQGPPT